MEQWANFEQLTGMLPAESPRLTVLNKCDLTPFQPKGEGSGEGSKTSESDIPGVRLSALTGIGIDELEFRIAAHFGLDQLSNDLPAGFLASHLKR
jgi:50S ribosomal subunit-associated GTPase HflX